MDFARAGYSALLRLATPVYFGRLWWRGRHEPLYRTRWPERLGLGARDEAGGRLWIHAVSLGETLATEALLQALRERLPALRVLLTHSTATGREAGQRLLRPGDLQVWMPYDTPGAVRRFIHRHRPVAGVLMETEVWPNIIAAAREAGLPLVLANARLSERSLAKGRRMERLMRPAVARLTRILAQTEPDARRLREIGGTSVQVMGNVKFDLAPNPRLVARGVEWRQGFSRPVVLAASTREGEEPPLLEAWAALPAPRPLLVIVPRHPQRFDEVAALVQASGLSSLRRSGWQEQPPADAGQVDVWLGDSLGEMPLYYGLADVALLGGSFARLGGHNLIEAAACGCPLVMGPYTFNFAQAAELSLAAGASVRVKRLPEAVARAVDLARDPRRNDWVQRALGFAAQHRGAAGRMAQDIAQIVRQAGG